MKNVILTAALIAVTSVGAASAMGNSSQLVDAAQNKLDSFGFTVDASTLTTAQLVGVHFVDNTQSESPAEIKARLASAIK